MNTLTDKNFGLLIAYVLPGFSLLLALSGRFPIIHAWIGAGQADIGSPTIGGFLYVTVASVIAGMTLGALRWLLLDTLHHRSGIRQPAQDFSMLPRRLAAFQGAVENHYRYYQFFGGMTLAALFSAAFPTGVAALLQAPPLLVSLAMLLLTALFFVASRDALSKYYARTSLILGIRETVKGVKRHDQRLARRP